MPDETKTQNLVEQLRDIYCQPGSYGTHKEWIANLDAIVGELAEAFGLAFTSVESQSPVGDYQKLLDLSTTHVSKETAAWLDSGGGDNPLGVYQKGDYGWFVNVPVEKDVPEWADGVPEDLARVIGYAQARGCQWAQFDRDADPNPDLPSFDW